MRVQAAKGQRERPLQVHSGEPKLHTAPGLLRRVPFRDDVDRGDAPSFVRVTCACLSVCTFGGSACLVLASVAGLRGCFHGGKGVNARLPRGPQNYAMAGPGLGTCHVVLRAQHSTFANCTPNVTYGCHEPNQMWTSHGCRGEFTCGSVRTMCESPWDGQGSCGCVNCHKVSESILQGGMVGLHCCSDNGAALARHGQWNLSVAANANANACRASCAATPGCTHISYSDAPAVCSGDLLRLSGNFGRCSLCGACSPRASHRAPRWQASYTSYAVATPLAAGQSLSSAGPAESSQGPSPRLGGVAALIISGCDSRYERAAAVARRAGLSPSWIVGIFEQNIDGNASQSRKRCRLAWPSAGEKRLLMAHRNAWSIIATANRGMVVLEDDIELATSSDLVQRDVRRCAADRADCELLFLGFVDAYWATHSLYVTPTAARRLLAESSSACVKPTDFYTHQLCVGEVDGGDGRRGHTSAAMASGLWWHRDHRLLAHCRAPNVTSTEAQGPASVSSSSQLVQGQRVWLRAREIYGMGHFVQNRTAAYIHGASVTMSRSCG